MARLREECGIAGIFGHDDAAHMIFLSLYALQHRGQEACGIVSAYDKNTWDSFDKNKASENTSDGEVNDSSWVYHAHRSFGLVGDSFTPSIMDGLQGNHAVGHVRYSTTGGQILQNVQPFSFNISDQGRFVIATNGNLTNAASLRKELEKDGSIFTSTSDTEVFVHLLAKSKKTEIVDKFYDVMERVRGAYSMVIQTESSLFALRDPNGFRPLVIGRILKDPDSYAGATPPPEAYSYVACSETCALDLIGAEYVREVEPGEIVALSNKGIVSYDRFVGSAPQKFCSFEPIYFSRPDSRMNNGQIYTLRKRMGMVLAKEYPTEADMVIAVPDSGVPMALGFGEHSGLPVELGLIRNHYVGRTFIQPKQDMRAFGVRLKFNAVSETLKGKRVVVVDDSIVRGTSSCKIIDMLRQAGAKEIHFRVGSPPYRYSCYYGVDTPKRSRLLASQKDVQQMCQFIGADSLGFLSIEGLKEALADKSSGDNAAGHHESADSHNSHESLNASSDESKYCFACFNGDYPAEIYKEVSTEPTDKNGPGFFATHP